VRFWRGTGAGVLLLLSAAAGGGPARVPVPDRELTDTERILLERAEDVLTRQCMRRHGFRYHTATPPTVEERQGTGYVLADVAWAREHGYGTRIRDRWLAAKQRNPNVAYYATLSPADRRRYDRALDGGPDRSRVSVKLPTGGTVTSVMGGCTATANEALYGDRATWFRADKVATNLRPLYVPAIMRDTRFTTALAAWRRCMAARGHRYADPPEIRARLPRLTKDLGPDEAHSFEVRLAVAEATCARRTPLLATARALEDHYRAEAARPYAEDLALHHRLEFRALDRARRITGS
jgi:hypothetical protein